MQEAIVQVASNIAAAGKASLASSDARKILDSRPGLNGKLRAYSHLLEQLQMTFEDALADHAGKEPAPEAFSYLFHFPERIAALRAEERKAGVPGFVDRAYARATAELEELL